MKFNETKDTVAERTKTTNFADGEAFEPDSAELVLYKVTINNLLEDTFYREDESELNHLVKRFEACADENPEFVLKLAKFARNDMGLRDVSQVLLVLAADHEKTKEYVDDYAADIMVRTDEPCTVVAAYDQLVGGSLPKALRRGIEDSLHNWDKYQYDKYDNRNREINMRDVINRVHPNPRDELREEIFERLMKGDKSDHPDVEPLDEADGATWETVISEKGNTEEAWRDVLDRMGIMAKLKNMRNMREAGLPSDEILDEDDIESVRYSRMFPFRIYQSYKALQQEGLNGRHVDEWMSKAIDTTTENLPDMLENTLSVADISGSMRTPVSGQSNLSCNEIATLFTASVGHKGADTGAFADDFEFVRAHSQTPTLELQQRIASAKVGGSTNGYKVFRDLRQKGKAYDRIMLFTDMQLWNSNSYYSDTTFKDEWEAYKEEVAPEASLYLVDLQSYGDLVIPEGAEDVYNISGWSEKVIDFIQYAENEGEIIQEIENYAPE